MQPYSGGFSILDSKMHRVVIEPFRCAELLIESVDGLETEFFQMYLGYVCLSSLRIRDRPIFIYRGSRGYCGTRN